MIKTNSTAIPMHVYSREDINTIKYDDAESNMLLTPNTNVNNNNKQNNIREKAYSQYVKKTKNKQLQMLNSQQYDTDTGYGDILTTTETWNIGDTTDIFRVGAVNSNGLSNSRQG